MSLSPGLKTFLQLAAKHPGRLVPVTRSFLAGGLTPVAVFQQMKKEKHAFLLESVERQDKLARYSFVGCAPEFVFRGHVFPQPGCVIERLGGKTSRHDGDPLAALERYLVENCAVGSVGAAKVPPFAGGAVGFLGYDVIRLIEPRLSAHPPQRPGIPGVPEMFVPIYRTSVVFDHYLNTISVVHHADPAAASSPTAAYKAAGAAVEKVVRRLRASKPETFSELLPEQQGPSPSSTKARIEGNFDRAGYMAAVEKAKEYIKAGDIIQVVLSQRLSCRTRAEPFEVYRSLRAINPSPYMFYLQFGDLHLVGSSPEVLVRVQNGVITVRPIAGTRPRGRDPAEDAQLAQELLADPKERAEHVMLLDLGRNDVGRVARFGSVKVDEQMIVEQYSHVMHIVSNVSGRIRPGLNAFSVLRACLPAGTVSGAPKIRAMEIIDELEPDRRGPYAGAVGVMDFEGNLETCIAIRTFVMRPSPRGGYDAYLQAGAGIVADSVPAREYDETLNKARALLRALAAAEARLGKG
ncbi:MAG: anthranilate synthase component I [Planctomycetota bacterium]